TCYEDRRRIRTLGPFLRKAAGAQSLIRTAPDLLPAARSHRAQAPRLRSEELRIARLRSTLSAHPTRAGATLSHNPWRAARLVQLDPTTGSVSRLGVLRMLFQSAASHMTYTRGNSMPKTASYGI